MVVYEKKIYIIAGQHKLGYRYYTMRKIFSLEDISAEWKEIEVPFSRYRHISFVVDEQQKMLFCGKPFEFHLSI